MGAGEQATAADAALRITAQEIREGSRSIRYPSGRDALDRLAAARSTQALAAGGSGIPFGFLRFAMPGTR